MAIAAAAELPSLWGCLREQELATPTAATTIMMDLRSAMGPANLNAPPEAAADDLLSCQEQVNLSEWDFEPPTTSPSPSTDADSLAVGSRDLSFSEWATSSGMAALRQEFAVQAPTPCTSSGSSSASADSVDLPRIFRRHAAKSEEMSSTATSPDSSQARKKRKSRTIFSAMGNWKTSHRSYSTDAIF